MPCGTDSPQSAPRRRSATTSARPTRCGSAFARSADFPRTGARPIESVARRGLRFRARSLAAHAAAAGGAGEARAGRCLPLARPLPPRRAVGGQGAAPLRRQGRPAAVCARRHGRARAGRRPAADAAGPAGDRGLPPSAPVAEGASGVVPARRPRRARHRRATTACPMFRTAGASPSPASCWCASGRASATPSS